MLVPRTGSLRRRIPLPDTGALDQLTTSQLVSDCMNAWGHPSRSPAPAIDQRIWARNTDRDIEIDNEQSVRKGNDVLRLDVEVGNTVAMEKSDTLYQLAIEIHNVVAKHPECESNV